eukprot:12260305-Heterocapsa_arctica.AAC.1
MALMRERQRALKLERRHAAAVASATLDPASCAAWNESFGLRAGDCVTASDEHVAWTHPNKWTLDGMTRLAWKQ